MEVSHWPVCVLRTPVSQAGVGLDIEVDSHWPVCVLSTPVLQVGAGLDVEVVSHWPVAELSILPSEQFNVGGYV